MTSIKLLPNDIIYLLSFYLDYYSYLKIINLLKESDYNFLLFYKRKANIINTFFYKKFYSNFCDFKLKGRKGHLILLDSILNNPKKYINEKIQCISYFQYNFSYFEPGYIIEGNIHCINGAWILLDIDTNRIHPLINPFIFPKSIRLLK